MRLLVDGVVFQLARAGIARVWSSILPRLASYPEVEIVLLDRGGCPSLDGIERVEFPSYTWTNTAADSFLIDRFCRDLDADVFASTYYTTPVAIPSVLMVYDMIPEAMGFDLNSRASQEKQLAISFARYYACFSKSARSDLKRFYPKIGIDRSSVTPCGVERRSFFRRDQVQVDSFKKRFDISKRYYLVVGSREQDSGYKNSALLFGAAKKIRDFEFEILFVGGEKEIPENIISDLPRNVHTRRLDVSDDKLACAYSGAEALVYPSLYEGFGMAVIEAMACGCPVITTQLGALGEIAGDAAVFISGHDYEQLRTAMTSVQNWELRSRLIEKGLQRASLYDWDATARGLYSLLKRAYVEREDPEVLSFFDNWKKLRSIQAEVDVGLRADPERF
jgi:glycosyltransferase involved in cell wall biosynthesis